MKEDEILGKTNCLPWVSFAIATWTTVVLMALVSSSSWILRHPPQSETLLDFAVTAIGS